MATRPKTKAGSRTRRAPAPGETASDRFFENLHATGNNPLLKGESGVIRFDLSGGAALERWYVTVEDGDLTVSHRGGRADTVIKVDRMLLDRVAEGTENAMAAQLRGALVVEGDLHLLMIFQRIFPGPPKSTKPQPISSAEVTAGARR